ncbi:MAG: PQQ-dependent sugar dehydrogenase [Planctomycetes bacterium]|nr:PQQ-dependent sugar dehydrogenase [Planctomycetota bacterium]
MSTNAPAETAWSVIQGETELQLQATNLAEHGLKIEAIGATSNQTTASNIAAIRLSASDSGLLVTVRTDAELVVPWSGELPHEGGIVISAGAQRVAFASLPLMASGEGLFTLGSLTAGFELPNARMAWNLPTQQMELMAPDISVSKGLAQALGKPNLAGVRIGELSCSMTMVHSGGDSSGEMDEPVDVFEDFGTPRGEPCGVNPGPDVIVGEVGKASGLVNDISNTSSQQVGGVWIDTFSLATYSCNVGTAQLQWISGDPDGDGLGRHPVIGQNFYRYYTAPDGAKRFEHIGQSWLKHGFTALQNTVCCTCQSSGTGSALGIGCADPYTASRNAGQSSAGPKWQVNPTTGGHTHPIANPTGYPATVGRRLQVKIDDLDLPGALYFAECQYVAYDDAQSGNQNNNASYRQITVTGSGNDRTFGVTGNTQRGEAGIRAWQDQDATVTEVNVQVPNDGLYIVAAKATDLGNGFYHYEYAIQNLNSDRGADGFSVPVSPAATVQNVGFHDVDYHSNDGVGNVARDGTDWNPTVGGGQVTWRMVDVGVNSNALRWGTIYNFRFDANVTPVSANATINIYADGTPNLVEAAVPTPGGSLILLDCNGNGIDDAEDIAEFRSADCDGDNIPDECGTICNLKAKRVAIATQPSFVTAPPGDTTRLFITELPGTIRILDLNTGTVLATPFLDIQSLVLNGGEDGLFSMAFHPNYASNGKFYLNYTTELAPRRTRIVEYTVSANPNVANAASAVILREITQPFSNHNGGQVQFGPDGMLYTALGDGGSQGDPNNNSQNNASLLGKMLRFDVDNPPTYLPSDNPGGAFLPEVWAKGFRNPWRFSFDRLNGNLFIGDVGQSAWEEIDFQPANSVGGENYGWRCYEGNAVYNSTGCGPIGNYEFPIHVVSHSDAGTISITGGYVYRGCDIPGLSGTYFFADYGGNYIRTFRYDGTTVSQITDRTSDITPDIGAMNAIVSFGEDASGEMYIVCVTGNIYRIECDIPVIGQCGNGTVEPGEECDPPDGENCTCDCEVVDSCTPFFSDNFQTNLGWTATGVTAGAWQRGVPVNCSSRGAPPSDADGSGQCYLTENSIGPLSDCNSDIDNGSVTLTSPLLNFANGGQIRYSYWINDVPTGALSAGDGLFVEISLNGGTTWTPVRSYVSPASQWRSDVILVGGGAGDVAASATLRIRFIASDVGTQNVVEAGVDAFIACTVEDYADCNSNCVQDATDIANLTSFDCNSNAIPDECEQGVLPCDCNGNGVPDDVDVANQTSADCNQNGHPDECDVVEQTALDCDGGPIGSAAGGAVIFGNVCMFCHNSDGSGGIGDPFPCGGPCPGPNIRNKSRRQVWNMLLPPTSHPGGAFPQFTQQDFADIEAFLADGGSRGRPDMIPDSCQSLIDCNENAQSDGFELEGGSQTDADYDGIPDSCQSPCPAADGDMNLDTLVNGVDLELFVSAMLGTPSQAETCHGDFSANLVLDPADVNGMVNALLNAP